MINKDRLQEIHNIEFDPDKANCWGSTLYVLGASKRPFWASERTINSFLRTNCKDLNSKKKPIGTIMVIRTSNGEILHTAVLAGTNKWWHKPGQMYARYASIKDIFRMYVKYGAEKIEYKIYTSKRKSSSLRKS